MIDELEALLASGQDSAVLRFTLATRYLAEGKVEKALLHAEVAVELDADYSAAWRLLGQAQVEAGKTREAAATYERGITVAERRGDEQAARQMRVFLTRLSRRE